MRIAFPLLLSLSTGYPAAAQAPGRTAPNLPPPTPAGASIAAQVAPSPAAPIDTFAGRPVYAYVEQWPEYPGGVEPLQAFLRRQLRYPPQYVRTHIEGRLFVAFILDRNGQVQRPAVVKGLAEHCDAEALRVVRLLPPFAPGRHHGQPVDVRYVLALRFACDEGWSFGSGPRKRRRP